MSRKSRKSLRIAVDARPLSSPLTGIGRYTHELLKRLIETNHDWFLYSDRPLQADLPQRENTVVRHGNTSGGTPGSLRWAQWEFVRWAKKDKVQTFWSPRHHLPLFLPSNIRTVVTIHDLVWRRFPATMQRKNYWLERLLMEPSIQKADSLIAVSNFTASELSHFYPEIHSKTTVVYEAADKKECDKGLPKSIPNDYLLFVGTLEPRKNLAHTLESYSQLEEPSLPLVIAGGNGWGSIQLEEAVSRLGLENRVFSLGYVSEERLGNLYANAKALVMPSLYEGFGLPIVEALKYGVPCIVSAGTALEEIAGNAAILVNPNSKSELVKALREIEDTETHLTLAKNAEARSAEFSWDKSASQTLAVLTG